MQTQVLRLAPVLLRPRPVLLRPILRRPVLLRPLLLHLLLGNSQVQVLELVLRVAFHHCHGRVAILGFQHHLAASPQGHSPSVHAPTMAVCALMAQQQRPSQRYKQVLSVV